MQRETNAAKTLPIPLEANKKFRKVENESFNPLWSPGDLSLWRSVEDWRSYLDNDSCILGVQHMLHEVDEAEVIIADRQVSNKY